MCQWNIKCGMVVLLFTLFGMTGCTSKADLIVMNQTEQLKENEADGLGIGEDTQTEPHSGAEQNVGAGQNAEDVAETEVVAAERTVLEKNVAEDTVAEQTIIYVHVCGAVENPGVYELSGESRIFEAIEAAGGFTEEADGDYVNQAQTLTDGMKIQIPTKSQTAEWIAAGDILMRQEVVTMAQADAENTIAGETVLQKVNINLADETGLCTITGIGQGRAKAIITYREQNGGFQVIEDIMKVDGIKQATFEKIKEQICVK